MEGRSHIVLVSPAHSLGPQAMRLPWRWCWHLNWALAVLVNAWQGAGTSPAVISLSLLRVLPLLFPLPGAFFPTHATIPSASA